MANSISQQDLQKKLEERKNGNVQKAQEQSQEQSSEKTGGESEVRSQSDNEAGEKEEKEVEQTFMPKEELFKFPIAPCSYRFRGARKKTICPDGFIRVSDPKEIDELMKKARLGVCKHVTKPEEVKRDKFDTVIDPRDRANG